MFEAWGEIFTVPTDKGDIRNLTRSPAVADRDRRGRPTASRSPISPTSPGEYELLIREQNGLGEVRHINLGESAVVLLHARLVARQQEDRLFRQAAEPLVRRPR